MKLNKAHTSAAEKVTSSLCRIGRGYRDLNTLTHKHMHTLRDFG